MRPVWGMVFRSAKESASNVGRQAAEGSEVAPLWLLWGLAATEALVVRALFCPAEMCG